MIQDGDDPFLSSEDTDDCFSARMFWRKTVCSARTLSTHFREEPPISAVLPCALCWLAVDLLPRAGCVSVGVFHASGLPNTGGSFGAKTCFTYIKYRYGF